MLHDIANMILEVVGDLGYIGIFIMMFLESTFFPFPSEIVMIPAGYLVYKGEMNLIAVLISGIAGSLCGALFNYYLAIKLGRQVLIKYGKYVFIKESTITKMETFFENHGHVSTFTGRLIPGVRQLISFPAGLAKMNLFTFSLYTTLGASIWVIILTALGYYMGDQQELISEYLKYIVYFLVLLMGIIMFIYYKKNKKENMI